MFCGENIHRVSKSFIFCVLILFHLCVAQDMTDLSLENQEGIPWKPPRRHLLWSSRSSNLSGPEMAIVIIGVIVISIIAACCKYCIKQGCEPPTDDYSDAVVHPPPRHQILTVPVAPSSGRRLLHPPRSSGSIILPPDRGVFSVNITGIENPNYNPSTYMPPPPSYHSPTAAHISMNEPSIENPTPLLDLPPPYEHVVKDHKFSK